MSIARLSDLSELIPGHEVITGDKITAWAEVMKWDDEALAEEGLARIEEAAPAPPGTNLISSELVLDEGVVRRVNVYSAPDPEYFCHMVDTERDQRINSDYSFDFGETPAISDAGVEIEAGVRSLQMAPNNIRDWQALYMVALAAPPGTLLPIRTEDNWNVQCVREQLLQCLTGAFQRGSVLTFYGGALKSQIRTAPQNGAQIVASANWPA